ncbi:hypothetical protein NKH18_20815 [Streptomyces sp. M10(2022)]
MPSTAGSRDSCWTSWVSTRHRGCAGWSWRSCGARSWERRTATAGPAARGHPGHRGRARREDGRDGCRHRARARGAELHGPRGGHGRAGRPAHRGGRRGYAGPGPLTVVVSGAPGIGKSALAHHVAHLVRDSFPAGRLVVRMTRSDGEPRGAGEVGAEVAAALRGVREGAGPARTGRCGPRRSGALAAARGCQVPGAVMVTSRMGLAGLIATHGGWVHRLSVFTEAESHALLLAVLGTERVGAEPAAARQLAALCGNSPLALRILTARLLTRPRCGSTMPSAGSAMTRWPGSP